MGHGKWADRTRGPGHRPGRAHSKSAAYEFGLCGMLCKIFWPMEDAFFEGTITRYNKTKNRHRIEYDDGDAESAAGRRV